MQTVTRVKHRAAGPGSGRLTRHRNCHSARQHRLDRRNGELDFLGQMAGQQQEVVNPKAG